MGALAAPAVSAAPTEREPALDGLHSVAYAEARACVAALSDAELAAAIREAKLDLAVAVTDQVLARASGGGTAPAAAPPSAALVALAEAAAAGRTVSWPDNVLRSLVRLARPEVDTALLFTHGTWPLWAIRRAITSDRLGPDGRPIIDAGLADQLVLMLDLLGSGEPAGKAPERYVGELVDAAAICDDPRIARAALDASVRLDRARSALCALATLCVHGLREEVWPTVRAAVQKYVDDKAHAAQTDWQWVLRIGEGEPFEYARILSEIGDRPTVSRGRWPDHGAALLRRLDPNWGALILRAGTFHDTAQYSWDSHGDEVLNRTAGRDDMPADVRREFEDSYAPALWLVPRPDVALLRRALGVADRLPAVDRHGALADLIRRGLVSGSLSAAEVVATVRPVAETLALLVPGNTANHNCLAPLGHAIPERALKWVADEVRAQVAAELAVLGEEPAVWGALWGRAMAWGGTVPELVAEVARATGVAGAGAGASAVPQAPMPRAPERHARTVDPLVVLVSLAPPPALADLLAAVPHDDDVAGAVARMLDRKPLALALSEFALGPQGTPDMRRSLARNTAADETTLWRLLLREPIETRVLAELHLRRDAGDTLRLATLIRSHTADGLHPALAGHLRKTAPGADTVAPALASGDPERIYAALRPVVTTIDPGHRALAYAALAAASGAETVWALELARVGTLEKADPAVRASMAAGDAAPLIAVVDGVRALMEAKRRQMA